MQLGLVNFNSILNAGGSWVKIKPRFIKHSGDYLHMCWVSVEDNYKMTWKFYSRRNLDFFIHVLLKNLEFLYSRILANFWCINILRDNYKVFRIRKTSQEYLMVVYSLIFKKKIKTFLECRNRGNNSKVQEPPAFKMLLKFTSPNCIQMFTLNLDHFYCNKHLDDLEVL
jgi:hypothetical protein